MTLELQGTLEIQLKNKHWTAISNMGVWRWAPAFATYLFGDSKPTSKSLESGLFGHRGLPADLATQTEKLVSRNRPPIFAATSVSYEELREVSCDRICRRTAAIALSAESRVEQWSVCDFPMLKQLMMQLATRPEVVGVRLVTFYDGQKL